MGVQTVRVSIDDVTDSIIACAIADLNGYPGGAVMRVPNLMHRSIGDRSCAGMFHADKMKIIDSGEHPMLVGANYVVIQKYKNPREGDWQLTNEYLIDFDETIDPDTFDRLEETIKAGSYYF